jgi:hypothetical protein
MANNSKPDIVAPAAGPMIESMRAHGYSTATAIADIIDNSISAEAKNVWLDFFWDGGNSRISILDDGHGMHEDTLRDSMRLGSKNPNDTRDPKDLGRFGLGMKTASFSQCRRLTVASRTESSGICYRRWDFEHVKKVKEWELLKRPSEGSEKYFKHLEKMKSGTMVLWEIVDRIVPINTSASENESHNRFLHVITEVEAYLAMVFHKYLEGMSPFLKIFSNGTEERCRIEPWDPFMEKHPATFSSPAETITHPHGDIVVKGFVLPHKDKMTLEETERASGVAGWNAQQGFYVYRNHRLLVCGGWLGLGSDKPWTQEEQYKLARIRIDIPNSQDMEWQIDVKKSTGKPPPWLRDRLRHLADHVRKRAREVFAHRGTYGAREKQMEISRAWRPKTIAGKLKYLIDREHPLVKAVQGLMLTATNKRIFDGLLRTLEETVPIPQIWLDTAEKSELHSRPFETADEMEKRRLVEITFHALRTVQGFTPAAARKRLKETEGFQDMDSYIDSIPD